MRVAIDIRRAGDYGLGTYIRNILNELARMDDGASYLLIGEHRHLEEFDALPANFELLPYPHEPGTFRTHLHLPWLLLSFPWRAVSQVTAASATMASPTQVPSQLAPCPWVPAGSGQMEVSNPYEAC